MTTPTMSTTEDRKRTRGSRFEELFTLPRAMAMLGGLVGLLLAGLYFASGLPMLTKWCGLGLSAMLAMVGLRNLNRPVRVGSNLLLLGAYLLAVGAFGWVLWRHGLASGPRVLLTASVFGTVAAVLVALLSGLNLMSAAKATLISLALATGLWVAEFSIERVRPELTSPPQQQKKGVDIWWGLGTLPHDKLGWLYIPHTTIKTCYPGNPRGYFHDEPLFGPLDMRMWYPVGMDPTQVGRPDGASGVFSIPAVADQQKIPADRSCFFDRLPLSKGQYYAFSFQARTDTPGPMEIAVRQAHEPYESLGLLRKVQLGSEWQSVRALFRATRDAPNVKIEFLLASIAGRMQFKETVFEPVVGIQAADGRMDVGAWDLMLNEPNQGQLRVLDPIRQMVRIEEMSGATQQEWFVQAVCDNLSVTQGTSYAISLLIRADSPRTLALSLGQGHAPWQSLGFYRTLNIDSHWQLVRGELIATASDENARLSLMLGTSHVPVEVAEVIVEPLGDGTVPFGSLAVRRWEMVLHEGALASLTTSPEEAGVIHVDMGDQAGAQPWHVQLVQSRFPVVKDQVYVAKLRARAQAPRRIALALSQSAAPWNSLAQRREIDLSTEWQSLVLPMRAMADEPRGRMYVEAGGSAIDFEVAEVSFAPATEEELASLTNGTGVAPWQLSLTEAQAVLRRTETQSWRVELAADHPGTMPWHVQLSQAGVAVRAGEKLRLMGRMRADAPRTVAVAVSQNHAPWKSLGLRHDVMLTPEWQSLDLEFAPAEGDLNGRLQLDVGGNTAAVEFAELQLILASAEATPAAEAAVESVGEAPTDRPSPGETETEPAPAEVTAIVPSSETAAPADGAPSTTAAALPVRHAVTYTMNSAGFRDDERTLEAAPNVVRVACLGDSFVWGQGVHAADLLVRHLERVLNENPPPGKRYEVLSFGVCGWSTEQERLCYENITRRYRPQIVLLFMVDNDNLSYEAELEAGFHDQPTGAQQVFHAWRLVAQKVAGPARDYQVCVDEIHKLDAACRQDGARLVPLIFRIYEGGDWEKLVDTVTGGLQGTKIPVLDMGTGLLAEHKTEELGVYPIGEPPLDMHPNEIAHRLGADIVAKFLKEQRLLPGVAAKP